MGILVFVLPSRGNPKIAAAAQYEGTTVGEKHTFLGLVLLPLCITSTDQFSLLVESW